MTDPRNQATETDPVLEAWSSTRARRLRVATLAAIATGAIAAIAAVWLIAFAEPAARDVVVTTGTETVRVSSGSGRAFPWGAVMVAIGIATVGAAFVSGLRRPRHSEAFLGAVADMSTIGRFAEALHHEDRYVRTEAEEALIAMLPRLKAGDSGLLNDRQRAALHRAIRPPRRKREADLVVAVIGALTEIADERAIPHVQRLAEEPARGPHQEAARAFASERLPILKERVEAARAVQTLVRPASAPDRSDTLLRPATAGPAGPVDQLVRPASDPDGS